MFCPECGAEFRDGITRCFDCEVALVDASPAEEGDPDVELVEVFRSADAALVPVVKSVLEGAEIPYSLQGDEASALFPLGTAGGGGDDRRLAVIVRVRGEQADEARELLAELEAPTELDAGLDSDPD